MRIDLEILKSVYFQLLESNMGNSPALRNHLNNESFWSDFNTILLDENNTTKELEAFLISYEFENKGNLLVLVNQLKNEYFSCLATEYCRGETNPSVTHLISSENSQFLAEMRFQKELQIAITKSERARLKSLIAESTEMDTEEPSVKKTTNVPVYASREGNGANSNQILKQWNPEIPRKVPWTFILSALAACFAGLFIWFGAKMYLQPKGSDFTSTRIDSQKVERIDSGKFAKIESKKVDFSVVNEKGIGFGDAGKANNVNVTVKDLMPRIQSIQDYLVQSANDGSAGETRKEATAELRSLLNLASSYLFDGTTLYLYSNSIATDGRVIIITSANEYFLKDGKNYYNLRRSAQPLNFKKVSDRELKEKLDKIVFDNDQMK